MPMAIVKDGHFYGALKDKSPGDTIEVTVEEWQGHSDKLSIVEEQGQGGEGGEGGEEETTLPEDTPKLAELNAEGLFTVGDVVAYGDLTAISGIGAVSAVAIYAHLGLS